MIMSWSCHDPHWHLLEHPFPEDQIYLNTNEPIIEETLNFISKGGEVLTPWCRAPDRVGWGEDGQLSFKTQCKIFSTKLQFTTEIHLSPPVNQQFWFAKYISISSLNLQLKYNWGMGGRTSSEYVQTNKLWLEHVCLFKPWSSHLMWTTSKQCKYFLTAVFFGAVFFFGVAFFFGAPFAFIWIDSWVARFWLEPASYSH